jgi:uncharacterized protein
MPSTNSTDGARSHARAQAATTQLRVPSVPPGASRPTWAEAIPAGSYATKVLGRGTRLRLSDPDGGACAHLLLFRADASWERLNVADTMKVPWQAYLGPGHPLLSDQGRLLATIVADTSGHHDALCGMSGAARAQMLLAVHKHGMDIRDVAPSLSLLKGARVADDGGIAYIGGAGPGAAVELLLHLPLVVVLVNAPHPLDPAPAVTDLDVVAWHADDDPTIPVNSDPEYLRALFNTESTWAAAQTSEALP